MLPPGGGGPVSAYGEKVFFIVCDSLVGQPGGTTAVSLVGCPDQDLDTG